MTESAQIGADVLRVAIAQIAPVWLDRAQTIRKVADWCEQAAAADCQLVVFGEALIPGYPFWLERTGGAEFDSPWQKTLHAHYLREAVQIERGDLEPICEVARRSQLSVMCGCVERPGDRGGHSLYCTLVYIDASGAVQSAHRKLMPTHEERLTWAPGDGHGLGVHELGPFKLGGLNCWENWMPLARAALYGFGEDLHVAVWPGARRNTEPITPFIAREGRSYVVSASALMRQADVGDQVPHAKQIRVAFEPTVADGGSCVASPTGDWLIAPVTDEETLIVCDLDHAQVRAERQNFDPAGHYARPDVLRMEINRWRQNASIDMQAPQHVSPAPEIAESVGRRVTSMPRLHELTDPGKLVVTLALEASRELQQLEVLPEHFLMALLLEGAGVAAGALGCLGLGYERLYAAIRASERLSVASAGAPFEPSFSEACHQVVSRAVMEAQSHGHRFASTEHLLLALCRVDDARLDALLEPFDLSRDMIRSEVATILRHGI